MSQTTRASELLDAFARQFASTVGGMAGGSGALDAANAPPLAPRWLIVVTVSGQDSGQLVLGLAEQPAKILTGRIMGLEGNVPDAAVRDTLEEFGSQTAGALGQDPVTVGLTLTATLRDASGQPPADAVAYDIPLGEGVTACFSVWSTVEAGKTSVETVVSAPGPAPVSHLKSGTSAPEPIRPGAPDNLDVILDIDLPITIRFGMANLSLQALTRLGPGSIIDLGRSPDDPVDLLVSGKVVARGEVVAVAGNYGVRIVEVVSTAERIRSMGA